MVEISPKDYEISKHSKSAILYYIRNMFPNYSDVFVRNSNKMGQMKLFFFFFFFLAISGGKCPYYICNLYPLPLGNGRS